MKTVGSAPDVMSRLRARLRLCLHGASVGRRLSSDPACAVRGGARRGGVTGCGAGRGRRGELLSLIFTALSSPGDVTITTPHLQRRYSGDPVILRCKQPTTTCFRSRSLRRNFIFIFARVRAGGLEDDHKDVCCLTRRRRTECQLRHYPGPTPETRETD